MDGRGEKPFSQRPVVSLHRALQAQRVPGAVVFASRRQIIVSVASASVVVAAVALMTAIAVHLAFDVPLYAFTQDPANYANVPPYVGAISTLGVMLWVIAATTSLMAAWVTFRAGRSQEFRFFAASAALSIFLAGDDALQLHEALMPRIGIPEEVVFAAYGVAVLLLIGRFYRVIASHGGLLLLISLAFLGISLTVDLLLPQGHVAIFFEDVAKLIGIALWAAFFMAAAAMIADPRSLP